MAPAAGRPARCAILSTSERAARACGSPSKSTRVAAPLASDCPWLKTLAHEFLVTIGEVSPKISLPPKKLRSESAMRAGTNSAGGAGVSTCPSTLGIGYPGGTPRSRGPNEPPYADPHDFPRSFDFFGRFIRGPTAVPWVSGLVRVFGMLHLMIMRFGASIADDLSSEVADYSAITKFFLAVHRCSVRAPDVLGDWVHWGLLAART
jgi:hypothetical protein